MLTESQEAQLLAAVAGKIEQLPSGTEIWTWRLVEMALADADIEREDGSRLVMDDLYMDELIEIDHEIRVNLDLGTGTLVDDSTFRYQEMGLPYNVPYVIRRPATPETMTGLSPYDAIDSVVFETARNAQPHNPNHWHELIVDTRYNQVYFTERNHVYGESIISTSRISDIKLKLLYDALWSADAFAWPSTVAGREPSTAAWKLFLMLANGTYLDIDFGQGVPPRFDLFLSAAIKLGWPDNALFGDEPAFGL